MNFISCLRLCSLLASHPSVCFLPYFVTMIDILIRLARICSLTSIWYLKSAQYLFVFTFGLQVIVDWAPVPVVTKIDNKFWLCICLCFLFGAHRCSSSTCESGGKPKSRAGTLSIKRRKSSTSPKSLSSPMIKPLLVVLCQGTMYFRSLIPCAISRFFFCTVFLRES